MSSQWISVEDKLPEPGRMVIVSGGIAYLRPNTGDWYTITAEEWPGKLIIWDVTHWQPIPVLGGQ